jgi:hypothetical protein
MSGAPVVSFIAPCFNTGATLERTLTSIRRQSFSNWEAVLIDDGSTDDTAAIAARLIAGEPRMRLIRQANAGLAGARNSGLVEARGEWVVFLDTDDWVADDFLEVLLGLAKQAPAAQLAVCRTEAVNDAGERLYLYPSPELSDPFTTFAKTCVFSCHAAVVRKDVVLALGGFDPELTSCEDWDLWQRLFRSGATPVVTDRVLASYRSRPSSMSRRSVEMVRNSALVIRRGHSVDPRVGAPDPRFAHGAPADQLPEALARAVMNRCGVAIGAGGDGVDILDAAGPIEDWAPDPPILARTLVGAIAHALAIPESDLAPRWSEFSPRLAKLCAVLQARGLSARAADATRAHAEGLVLGAQAFATFENASVHAQRIDLTEPLQALDPKGRELVIAAVHAGGEFLGVIEAPAAGVIPVAELAALLRDQAWEWPLGHALQALRAWAQPSFLQALAGQAASWHFQADVRRHGLRKAVYQIAGPALRHALPHMLKTRPAHRPDEDALRSFGRWGVAVQGVPAHDGLIVLARACADAPGGPQNPYQVSAAQVEAVLDAVGAHRTLVGFDYWASASLSGRPARGRPVMLALDGAGLDPNTDILERLDSRSAPVCVFLPVNLDGELRGSLTWERLKALQSGALVFGWRPIGVRLATLSVAALDEALLKIQARFTEELGAAAFAALFDLGDCDRTTRILCRRHGFAVGVHGDQGRAGLFADPLMCSHVPMLWRTTPQDVLALS